VSCCDKLLKFCQITGVEKSLAVFEQGIHHDQISFGLGGDFNQLKWFKAVETPIVGVTCSDH